MSDTLYRGYCTRQHHVLGHYLAVQAWNRGLDCIVLQRADLEFFLGLQRFKSVRVDWLREDLRPWFTHQEAYYKTGAPSSIHSLFLGRVSVTAFLPKGSMSTALRFAGMSPGAPKTAVFFDPAWVSERPSAADMVSQLALLSSGVSIPANFQPKRSAARRVIPLRRAVSIL
jgi:hypothetical protein